jgi:hypothetical protein
VSGLDGVLAFIIIPYVLVLTVCAFVLAGAASAPSAVCGILSVTARNMMEIMDA